MKHSLAATRAVLTWIVVTACLLTAGLVVAVPAQAATRTYTASATVEVHASGATDAPVLGTLAKGDRVKATKSAKSGWLPITYATTTGYVVATELTVDKTPASAVITGPAGKRSATENVNLRASAGLDADIVAVVKKGVPLKVTGLTMDAFAQIDYKSMTSWVLSEFLSTSIDTTPDVVATYTTITSLALRATASVTAKSLLGIAKHKLVGGTGNHSGGYSKVVYKGKVGWVITGYLKAVAHTASAFKLPIRKSTRYVNAVDVPLKAGTLVGSAKVATLAFAQAMRTTGRTKNGFTQVIWDGGTRWVSTGFLSKTAPPAAAPATSVTPADPGDLGSSSLNKLEPYGKAAVVAVRAEFPKIKTIYGWRSSSSYSSDHPNGRATDNMIPDYKSNKALGDALAAWVIANGKRLHVTYLIWRQRSYTISRGTWKNMANRGSDTANHMNHVHISFEPS
ncbi:MAG: SH3 domain-containing protein [Propionicimonas sp.]